MSTVCSQSRVMDQLNLCLVIALAKSLLAAVLLFYAGKSKVGKE